MLIKKPEDIKSSEITSETAYLNRRQFMGAGAALIGGGLLASCAEAEQPKAAVTETVSTGAKLQFKPVDKQADNGFYTGETLTPEQDVTSYNNFYEFGTNKGDPRRYADKLTISPWTVEVSGEAEVTGKFNLEDILAKQMLEERIYRLRCVEAWSMVIPWVGFSLADMLKQFKPTSNAKYVKFETLVRRSEMRGQRSRSGIIDWPYEEALRIDEAMHPLSFIATGLYGKEIPKQNGAPLRLVVPWKYGFKSIKSIVSIKFTERKPRTSWVQIAPREYGFYANVNPDVDHPRWSQSSERRLPSTLFEPNRIATMPFNGYAEQVASLYTGMDLRRNY
jgi:sulfoxide reductase catalytic subunit YedY